MSDTFSRKEVEILAQLVGSFDFEIAQSVYQQLDWKILTKNGFIVPSEEDLISIVVELFTNVCRETCKDFSGSSAGLMVGRDKDGYYLKHVVQTVRVNEEV